MTPTQVQLPYFDLLLEGFSRNNPDLLQAFGRHVHWGYWQNPATADGSIADFAAAAEILCQRVCDAAPIQAGHRILDCGCGFGGTIASLNERFSPITCVGVNIDERQLIRARQQVQPQPGNDIEFIQSDACQLPFEDNSFDIVLAVECIFHFPSRVRFFQEARRVLRKGGTLTICDFVPRQIAKPLFTLINNQVQPAGTYGTVNNQYTLADYRQLAINSGFTSISEEDITLNTVPTYPIVRQLMRQMGSTDGEQVTAKIEWLTRSTLLRYLILSFAAN